MHSGKREERTQERRGSRRQSKRNIHCTATARKHSEPEPSPFRESESESHPRPYPVGSTHNSLSPRCSSSALSVCSAGPLSSS
jgi:hypothetical protein